MENTETIPSVYHQSPSPEYQSLPDSPVDRTSSQHSSGISEALTPGSAGTIPRLYRSKSLSHIRADAYTPGEIRRMKERLLRTNSHVEPSALRKLTRSQRLTLISLALVDFMTFCSMSIMAPFFPREAAEKGLSDTMSGFVFSFYALVMFISSPILGKFLPKVGAKFLFISGMFIAGACNLLFGTLEFIHDYTLFTTFCILIRGLEALGACAFSTASYVFVVNTFPNNIGSVLGILETFVGLGMSTGPVIGGFLYSVGGFDLPFFVLGMVMIITIPINVCLLPNVEDSNIDNKKVSVLKLIKVPGVAATGLIVIIISSTWAFLDPTLEPHLRQYNLSPEQVGLIFLLFSALYAISSPCWGWLADKVHNHWSMMVAGLFISTLGLLSLGPSPCLPFLKSSLWLNLVALSILGVSVALTLLPTFQSVLTSALEGGFTESISTYSLVAGVWSCMYSLGEVIGPSLGGFLMQQYGFPITSTLMACMTFILGVVCLFYFTFRSVECTDNLSDSCLTESWKSSNKSYDEKSPLIGSIVDPVRFYTEEKIQCYEQSRKLDNELSEYYDADRITDVRGTIAITARGSCEV